MRSISRGKRSTYSRRVRFVISTPRRVFVFDAERGTTTDLLLGGGEYYGVSWDSATVYLGRSARAGGAASDARPGDVVALDRRGGLSAVTPGRLRAAHQIEAVDGRLVVADTGNDRVSVFDADGTLVTDVGVAELGGGAMIDPVRGAHLNSVHYAAGRLWVVGHNHDEPSLVWELGWPSLEVVSLHRTAARWAHNVWIGEHGLVVCDSRAGALKQVGGTTLWTAPNAAVVTRGLAVGGDWVAVGRSAVGGRRSRADSDGGFWLLDRTDLGLVDEFVFPGSGVVNELRLLDVADDCHTGTPAPADFQSRVAAAHALFGAATPDPVASSSAPRRRVHRVGTRTDRFEPALATFAGAAAAARETLAGLSDGVDVLVWMPYVSPAGGARLALSLLPPLAESPLVRTVRLVVPRGSVAATEWPALIECGVSVVEIDVDTFAVGGTAWLHRDGADVYGIDGDDQWRAEVLAQVAGDVDVIYVPWPHRGRPIVAPAPVVCTVQDTTLIDFPEGLGAAGADEERRFTGAWVASSAAVVVSSENTRNALVRLFGEQAGHVHVIHHAISPRVDVGDEPLPDELLARLPERYVICATNVSPHKNLDLLLHGWSRFEHRHDWPLLVIGYGTDVLAAPPLDRLRTWRDAQIHGVVTRLGLGPANGLHALGYVPDAWVRPLIAGAAALVMPSVTEGGGSFPVEEALTAGVPVLCSDIPVMREHLGHHSAQPGWFDPWSAASIAQAARDLVADYPSRRAQAVRGQVDRRPRWEDVAGEYGRVLHAAAARGRVC